MYDPIQIPYILSKDFAQKMKYVETPALDYGGFVICFWEMQPLTDRKLFTENIIVADACIDLVANYDAGSIGFSGMSKTEFHFKLDLPARCFGARLAPGAFHQLTGLSALSAMDAFLPIESVFENFDKAHFFSLPFTQAQVYFKEFLRKEAQHRTPDMFTGLFNMLYQSIPATTKELYVLLHFSPRQCQRLFNKHYGITPKMTLSIIRFQKCLEILTSRKASPADILNIVGYYDQPHFINDFKRNIGITPMELIRIYQT
ncbi:MAG: helix-turn-helix domain-containing protein [Lachnospiraceae bacterium]